SGTVQMSGLRLDSRESLLKGGAGGPAIVPGQPDKSPLISALHYTGKTKMPPAGKLADSKIAALAAWVKAGAPWPAARVDSKAAKSLWAFQPLKKPALPAPSNRAWVKSPVDAFILSTLEKQGLKPSPYADRHTLIRRVSLDLTGLPPTPEEVEAFVGDRSPSAYEKVVDRLLQSKHYGERMAHQWLDLARYADSDGYHDDTDRAMWAFRDYVITAFNTNKRFDQFTVEQLAGDLLSNATHEQKVASAFNRCGPTTSEGGAVPEEVLAKYAVDRVNTTTGVWLGLTVQCAECHDHKYDPVSAKEYYQFFAFFNQVPEEALYRGADAPPTIATPTPEQTTRLAAFDQQIAALEVECGTSAGADPKSEAKKKLEETKKARAELAKFTRLRVMADVPQRRPTHVLLRGDYRSRGDEVQPGVPAALGNLPTGMTPNRLALAKWLVDPRQPLTPRVTVNRFWQMIFGTGIVKTSDDFGVRGEQPSHPELLDYLAADFVESGWDVKRLIRLIVTSAAYQQSSRVTPALLARDPHNRLLARGARFRLPAEMIRDNALAISGLLDREREVGGPSVKPYQPGDLWRELAAGDQEAKGYVQDHGPDLYRRGLYTFWKRSVLYPSFAVFDAPKREVCTAMRPVTNTPLQAFVTLNDTTYVEAARVFAQRILEHGGDNLHSRLTYAMQRALGRGPTPRERRVLGTIYADMWEQYRADPQGARELVAAGESPRPAGLDVTEHAVWTCVCNAILNLDETITRE
ncbi:MAG TPA: PSD1 and planctomycete cytochrome C domain-containing protein, partial [Armatimonadota bacterium]|nr:PSD1 and planctomycete cytochrome C domain-containing protein [Armatimonadota bacterium]